MILLAEQPLGVNRLTGGRQDRGGCPDRATGLCDPFCRGAGPRDERHLAASERRSRTRHTSAWASQLLLAHGHPRRNGAVFGSVGMLLRLRASNFARRVPPPAQLDCASCPRAISGKQPAVAKTIAFHYVLVAQRGHYSLRNYLRKSTTASAVPSSEIT